jgi:hypothetical protein
MNKIYKQGENLIIEIPLKQKRFCPFTEEEYGEMDNLIGLIIPKKFNYKCGFAERIDMAYKDKGDQNTDIFYEYWGDKEDFIKLCGELGIEVSEYPKCDYCGNAIMGCFTMEEKGNMCYQCKNKNEK